MRISKMLPLTCAAVLFAGISVRADDSAAQAAARAALMQKMQEMNDQPADAAAPAPAELPAADAVTGPAPAPVATKPAKGKKSKKAKTPAPAAAPAPAPYAAPASEPAPAVAVAPVAVAPTSFQDTTAASAGGDNAAQAQARAALMQKMNEPTDAAPQGLPEGPPHDLSEPPAPEQAPAMAETPAPAIAPSSPELAPTSMPETPVQAKARAALMQKMQEMNLVAPVAAQPETVETAPAVPVEDQRFVAPSAVEIKKRHPGESADNFGFKPIVAPNVPVSSEKELELRALLERYKADLITPEQYHAERAQIVGTP